MQNRKRRIAAAAALSLILLLTGCADTIREPAADAYETAENTGARDVSESAAGETSTAAPEQTEQPTDAAEEATEDYRKPTEAVTYTDEGILISNAYYSLRLPKEWDGHYRCSTSYSGDVMWLQFFHLYGDGGHLFELSMAPTDTDYDYDMLPAAEKLHTLTDGMDTYLLYVLYPTDVQYEAQWEEQYLSMQDAIEGILGTLEPGAGFTFAD